MLDIETEKAMRGEVSDTPLPFAGVKVYSLDGGRYHASEHRVFLPEDMQTLQSLLCGVEGIVLGHNILRFDYAALGSYISLEGIEDKTVDTFLFLYERVSAGRPESGMLEGWMPNLGLVYFSLENLATLN